MLHFPERKTSNNLELIIRFVVIGGAILVAILGFIKFPPESQTPFIYWSDSPIYKAIGIIYVFSAVSVIVLLRSDSLRNKWGISVIVLTVLNFSWFVLLSLLSGDKLERVFVKLNNNWQYFLIVCAIQVVLVIGYKAISKRFSTSAKRVENQ
jgi:hypothetical protein